MKVNRTVQGGVAVLMSVKHLYAVRDILAEESFRTQVLAVKSNTPSRKQTAEESRKLCQALQSAIDTYEENPC